jgi:hypothetical protein
MASCDRWARESSLLFALVYKRREEFSLSRREAFGNQPIMR